MTHRCNEYFNLMAYVGAASIAAETATATAAATTTATTTTTTAAATFLTYFHLKPKLFVSLRFFSSIGIVFFGISQNFS